MKIERSKEWWLKQADKEGDGPVAAGVPATPTPTHASAVLGMEQALRRIGLERCQLGPAGGWCNDTGAAAGWCEHQDARAALEAWERRPRLRDDGEFLAQLGSFFGDVIESDDLPGVAEAIDAALGASPGDAAVLGQPEPCRLYQRASRNDSSCYVCGFAERRHRTGPHPGGEPAKEKSE